MRTTFRFLLIAAVVVGVLGAIGAGVASWYYMRKLGPDFWVGLIEENTNCRAEISSAQLSLLTRPSTLKLKDVRLAPRDAEVEKPYTERAAMAKATAPIFIPEITLEVKLEDLINRRLFIQHLSIVRPDVRESQDENGHSSLERLFSKHGADLSSTAVPMTAQPLPPQRYTETTPPPASSLPPPLPQPPLPPRTQALPPAPPPSAAADSSTSADSSAFAVSIASAEIQKGHFNNVNRGTSTEIQNLDFRVSGIDLNSLGTEKPRQMHVDLATEISVTGMARIGGVKKPAELARLMLTGTGDVSPIDLSTGAWNPTSVLRLTLAKGSVLGGHMTLGDAAGKEIKKLQEYGVDLSPLPIGGALQEDAIVQGTFGKNRFTLGAPVRFVFPEYEVAIEAGSWVNGPEDDHHLRFHLSCGPALQQRLESGIAQAKLGDSIARAVTKALSDDHGRMTFDMVSNGPLSEPKVKPSLDRLLKNLIKGEGLNDLLKGLFKK